jgi:hypothetical protein
MAPDSVPPAAMTSDEVWHLIEGKVTQQLRFLKIAVVVVLAIISFFLGIIGWLLSDREIRERLVTKYVLDVAEQLNKPDGTKALDQYMKQTLAYTYSSRFTLGAGRGHKSEDAIPFYKTETDRGRLTCTATYPNNSVRNVITAQWNDLGLKLEFEHPEGSIAKLETIIPTTKKDLFGSQALITPNQKVRFNIAPIPPFEKGVPDVSIDCTMAIVGPARFTESLD